MPSLRTSLCAAAFGALIFAAPAPAQEAPPRAEEETMSTIHAVPARFAADARVDKAAYERDYAESVRDPEAFWGLRRRRRAPRRRPTPRRPIPASSSPATASSRPAAR